MPMPPTLVAHIGAEVARGLHYAHRADARTGSRSSLVHRDVTPHNVLLSFDGAVKLTDFGIAKAGDQAHRAGHAQGQVRVHVARSRRAARRWTRAPTSSRWASCSGSCSPAGGCSRATADVAVLRAVQQSIIAPPARLNPDVPAAARRGGDARARARPGAALPDGAELERALAEYVLRGARVASRTPTWARSSSPRVPAQEDKVAEATPDTGVHPHLAVHLGRLRQSEQRATPGGRRVAQPTDAADPGAGPAAPTGCSVPGRSCGGRGALRPRRDAAAWFQRADRTGPCARRASRALDAAAIRGSGPPRGRPEARAPVPTPGAPPLAAGARSHRDHVGAGRTAGWWARAAAVERIHARRGRGGPSGTRARG